MSESNQIHIVQSLATRILRSLSVRVTIIVLISSVFSYLHLFSNLKESTIHTLEKYVDERTQRETFVFEQAEKSHAFLKTKIEKFLESDELQHSQNKFDLFVERKEDGTFRNKLPYDGKTMAGVFIPPHYRFTKEKKNLVTYLKDLAEKYGPVFRSNFQDTYFTTPENVMVIYWPEVPNWTMEMDASFDMTKEEYVWIADEKNNPERKMVWTGLFYDKVGQVWMTSAETPVYKNDQHLLTIGHDIMLKELLERASHVSLPGAYNVIFREDGRLILHPNKVKELKDRSGYFDINKDGDRFLKGLKDSILGAGDGLSVVEHSDGNDLLAFGKIEGPGWYFVVVYPKSLITSSALDGILFVILLAIISLLLEVTMIWLVLKKEVSQPIQELYSAAKKITSGDFKTKVKVTRSDELGAFADAFNTMTETIRQRDKELHDHAESLEHKVQKRTDELDEQRAVAIESSKMASLGEMAGGIAHEINNPLTIISLAMCNISRTVENGKLDKEVILSSCKTIEQTVHRINKIITGLRTISRGDASSEPKYEKVQDIIDDVTGLCFEKMKMNGVELKIEASETLLSSMFRCLRVQLSQVLLNLLNNSYDAIKEQEEKWIVIKIEKTSKHMVFSIIDSGKGIDLALEEKIFQPFFTTKPIGKGTGLGLSLSRSLIEQQNGKMYIDHKNLNTCFVIELEI